MNIIVAADRNWAIGKGQQASGKHSGRYEDVSVPGNNRKSGCHGTKDTGNVFRTDFR